MFGLNSKYKDIDRKPDAEETYLGSHKIQDFNWKSIFSGKKSILKPFFSITLSYIPHQQHVNNKLRFSP